MFILSRRGGLLGQLVAARLQTLGHEVGILGTGTKGAESVAPGATGIELGPRGEVGAAMVYAKGLLLLPEGPDERPIDEATLLAEAKSAGVRRVVRSSIYGADAASPDPFLAQQGRGDEAVIASGISHSILQSHLLMQDLLLFAPSIRAGFALIAPDHDPRIGFIDIRDVADAAVKLLQRPIHQGETQVITGPRAWTMPEIAEAIEEATGRNIPVQTVPVQDLARAFEGIGLSSTRARAVAEMFKVYDREDGTTRAVSRITGLPPRALEMFLLDHRHRFADSRIERRVEQDQVTALDHALNW